MEQAEDGSYVCRLTGQLTGVRNVLFRQIIKLFYIMHGDVLVVFDCGTLAWIDQEGIRVLADLKAAGRRFLLKNPSADCTVLFMIERLAAFLEEKNKLPQIDLSGCEKINEGANGVIYRVNDEVVAKTFKNGPDYYDLVRLPLEKCQRIWDLFIGEYFQGQPEKIIREKTAQARLIGTVLALAKMIKKGTDPAFISYWAKELQSLVSGAD